MQKLENSSSWRPDWDEVGEWLQDANAVSSPAELQSYLAGRVVAGDSLTGDRGFVVLHECLNVDVEILKENDKIWVDYLRTVIDQIEDDQYQLTLLLPDDDQPLPIRLLALAQWSQGFLGGLGSVATAVGKALNESSKELLADLVEISQLSVDEEQSEENEVLYAELAEYVRISVFNLAAEFRIQDEPRQTLQ